MDLKQIIDVPSHDKRPEGSPDSVEMRALTAFLTAAIHDGNLDSGKLREAMGWLLSATAASAADRAADHTTVAAVGDRTADGEGADNAAPVQQEADVAALAERAA